MFAARSALFTTAPPAPASSFVTRDSATGHLYLNGQRFRFGGTNCSTVGLAGLGPYTAGVNAYGATADANGYHWPSHSEIDAILAEAVGLNSRVIRAYAGVLSVGSVSAVQPTLGSFQAAALANTDYFLQRCNELGIKVIFPLVDNYEYAVLGKKWYCDANGVSNGDDCSQFFVNTTVINSFKAHISFVLNHVNSITGVAYKDDPAIAFWETGNELSGGSLTNAQLAAHLSTICTHIKTTLGAQQLVMDGIFGMGDYAINPPPYERLAVALCDAYTDHCYDQWRVPTYLDSEGAMCKAFGKAFYVGEITSTGYSASGGGLAWTREEITSQIVGSTNIDGSAPWATVPPLMTPDVFSLPSPATASNNTLKYSANLWADHNADMATRTSFGPRIVAQGVSYTQGQVYRGFGFNSTTYRCEVDDLVVGIGGNNNYPATGPVAADYIGWSNPLGSGGSISVDNTMVGAMQHRVTAAEQEAGTTTFLANLFTNASWGGQAFLILRGVSKDTPIAAINTVVGSTATTTHTTAPLPGASVPDDGLVFAAVFGVGNPAYTNPLDTWGTLGTSNVDQSVWAGKLNKLTTAGVTVPSRNLTVSTPTKYLAVTICFNKAPVVSYPAIAPTKNTCGAIGDSKTAYGGGYYYMPWLGPTYLNQLHILSNQRIRWSGTRATGGWHMTQIRDTHIPQIVADNPGACIMHVATNDLAYRFAYIQRVFYSMIRTLLDANIAPILVLLEGKDDVYVNNFKVWNTFIRQFALANGYAILDCNTPTANADGSYKTPGYTSDGLHPTEFAYRKEADQGITDGLPAIFPAAPTGLTSQVGNMFGDGTMATDTNSDGVSNDWVNKSAAGTFSLVTVGGWTGKGQRLQGGAGQPVFLNTPLGGWVAGKTCRFATKIQTENITASGAYFVLSVDATVPGGATMPNGSAITTVRNGIVNWFADTEGLFDVEFTVPAGTTALTVWAYISSVTSGSPPKLTIGELTVVRTDVVPTLYPPVKRPNYGALLQF